MALSAHHSKLLSHREAGSGPALVLLHAFPFDSEMWEGQLREFSANHRVIAPDFPGFGKSPADAHSSIEHSAERVAELMDGLGIREPIVLAGLSMGGYVALAFARKFSARLGGLILADTKADPDDEAARNGRDQAIETALKGGTVAVVEPLMQKLLGPTTLTEQPAILDHAKSIALRQAPSAVISALQSLRDRSDSRPGLSRIAVPTLVIVGEADAVTPPTKARELCNGIANSQLVVVPKAGHLSNLENADAFNHAVRTFLIGLSHL